jgi:hypothetical protein
MRIGRNEQKINRPEREEPGGVGVGAARARCEKNHTTSRRRERRSSTVLRGGGERGGQGRGEEEERGQERIGTGMGAWRKPHYRAGDYSHRCIGLG